MRLQPITFVVPDALNGGRLELRGGVQFRWQLGVDVTIPGVVIHQDGSPYGLAGAVAAILAFYKNDTDALPTVQVEWTITGSNTFEFYITRDMGPLLPVTERGYVVGARFRDDDRGYEDAVQVPGRLVIERPLGSFHLPVTVPPMQVPLAQGPGFVDRGTYAGGSTYAPRDLVQFTIARVTSTYACILATTGNAPPNATYWNLWASGGAGFPDPSALSDGTVMVVRGGAWVSGKLTPDDLGAAFAISSFVGGGGYAATKELGDTIVNPSFTMSYNATPDSVTIDDGSGPVSLSAPFTSHTFVGTYSLSALGSKNFTLSATKGGVTRTSTLTSTWEPRAYFGKALDAGPGPYNSAFITALPSSALAASRQRSAGNPINTTTGAGEYVFYAFPSAFSGATANSFIDLATGFPFGMLPVASAVNVTNGFGVVVPIDVWRSQNPNLGSTSMEVT